MDAHLMGDLKEVFDVLRGLLSLLNVLIVPIFIYMVKIEKRFASGDTLFDLLKRICPGLNPNARCPIDGHTGNNNNKRG